jgi:hypothetical protein
MCLSHNDLAMKRSWVPRLGPIIRGVLCVNNIGMDPVAANPAFHVKRRAGCQIDYVTGASTTVTLRVRYQRSVIYAFSELAPGMR